MDQVGVWISVLWWILMNLLFFNESWWMFYFTMNPDECSVLWWILMMVVLFCYEWWLFYFLMNPDQCSILFQNKTSPALGLRSSKLRRAWVNCPRLITRRCASYSLISTGSWITHLMITIVCICNHLSNIIVGKYVYVKEIDMVL